MTAVTGQVVVLNCAIKVTEFVGPNEKKKFTIVRANAFVILLNAFGT